MKHIAGNWVQHGGNVSSNLPLTRVSENVGIFREIAREAMRRGLLTWPNIRNDLHTHEIRVLAHLFHQATLRNEPRLTAIVRMFAIVATEFPVLLLDWRMLRSLADCTFRLSIRRFRDTRQYPRS
jgi:hypothetical protein